MAKVKPKAAKTARPPEHAVFIDKGELRVDLSHLPQAPIVAFADHVRIGDRGAMLEFAFVDGSGPGVVYEIALDLIPFLTSVVKSWERVHVTAAKWVERAGQSPVEPSWEIRPRTSPTKRASLVKGSMLGSESELEFFALPVAAIATAVHQPTLVQHFSPEPLGRIQLPTSVLTGLFGSVLARVPDWTKRVGPGLAALK